MKKSVYTFGLLLSSMVMLSAIPMLNNNNNTVAMAQGYYHDERSYSTYPTDEKNMNVEQVHLKASLSAQ